MPCYATLIEPRLSCPPESTLGFFLRGAGVGASPVIQLGICEELVVTAGATAFFANPVAILLLLPKAAVSYRVHLHITVRQLRAFRKFFHFWTVATILIFDEVLTIETMF